MRAKNQEEIEQNEIDKMKKGVDSTHLGLNLSNLHLYTACVHYMYRPLSVWCVQAGVVSGCGVDYYSSVMQWMVVEVVCVVHTRCWFIPYCEILHKMCKILLKNSQALGKYLCKTVRRFFRFTLYHYTFCVMSQHTFCVTQ